MFATNHPSLVRLMMIGAGAVIIIAGVRAASNVVNLLLLAFVVTLVTAPLYKRLIKWRVPSMVAVLLALLLLFVAFLAFIWFLGVSVAQFEEKLPTYTAQFELALEEMLLAIESAGLDTVELPRLDFLSFGSLAQSALSLVTAVLSGFRSIFSNAIMIVFIVFFALFEVTTLPKRLARGLGADDKIVAQLNAVNSGARKYIIIKTWTGLLAAAANTLLLVALGVDFALLWGVLSFLLNYIPTVGFIIALIPPVLMALLQFGLAGVPKAIIIVVGYFVINTITDNVIAPKVMGRGLNLSPLVIFIALIFWAWILGPVGAIMAVPLTIMVKTLLEGYDETRWLADAMSAEAAE